MGMKPKLATQAVISTGRSLRREPASTASQVAYPESRAWLIELTRTTPFNMATPNSAMNPTEADRFRFMPHLQRAAMPPTRANGILPTTSSACLKNRKVRYGRKYFQRQAVSSFLSILTYTLGEYITLCKRSACPTPAKTKNGC